MNANTVEPANWPSTRRWPIWTAGCVAGLALLANVVIWMATTKVNEDAEDAEAAAVVAEKATTEAADGTAATNDQIQQARSQVEMMEGLLEPGMAQAIGAVYLQAITTGCEQDPRADPDDLIQQISAAGAPPMFGGHEGWAAAIDHEAIGDALADCERGDG